MEAGVVALVLAGVHLLSPAVSRSLERRLHAFTSFSGGLAVAYVFLHLLPELDEGREVVGSRIYFLALLGFVLFYGVEYWIHRSGRAEPHRAHFRLYMSIEALYTALIVFTLGQQLPDTIGLTVVFTVSLGLHLLGGDIGSLETFGEAFRTRGRYVLAGAALVGHAMAVVREPHEVATDIVTAVLAGFFLFNVFQEELPDIPKARLGAFVAGITSFFVMREILMLGAS